MTTSGCGTVVKDYGYLLREDRAFASRCRAGLGAGQGHHRVSSPALGLVASTRQRRSSSSPITPLVRCSTGRKSRQLPKELLSKNGFVVKDVPESHLCCGSAGTYNILQPDIASRLRDRKVANIASVKPDMIAAGNIGCMVQIAGGTSVPVVHTIELLDWATGGPRPSIELDRSARPSIPQRRRRDAARSIIDWRQQEDLPMAKAKKKKSKKAKKGQEGQ